MYESKGTVNRTVRAALIIQTFNHWFSDRIGNARGISWRQGLTFPKLVASAVDFAKAADDSERSDTSRAAVKLRILQVMTKAMNRSGEVCLSEDTIAARANTSRWSVKDIIPELRHEKKLIQVRGAKATSPARYQVIKPAAMG
jgi:hypothetical protein